MAIIELRKFDASESNVAALFACTHVNGACTIAQLPFDGSVHFGRFNLIQLKVETLKTSVRFVEIWSAAKRRRKQHQQQFWQRY